MKNFATVYGLLYGDDFKLHNRFLDSLFTHVPRDTVDVRLWCNVLCEQTKQRLMAEFSKRKSTSDKWLDFYFCPDNRPKYKAMADMFTHRWKPGSAWVIWFDDDSYIEKADWCKQTVAYIKEHPDTRYIGQPWFVHHLPGQWDFIKKADWYRGLPPEQCPTRTKGVTKPGITFAQGAYWWLRTDVLNKLNWPDPRLNHNGGDTLLGEAIRQQGLSLTKFHYGVQVNKYKRRGMHEKPAGSLKDIRR
jgi:hypothetical protein